ncbi:EF-Tu/IF-2/RF-3 family GTPase [Methanoculleus sp. 7T]|uniref:EF-Tu/IF-2/RF-3 family GTPase n=1 Tax=Methanoculleus sp. 7T TaxID=2937282 RepID=UPI0020C035C4|nr:EF-Tu/IF-2/RF-3 family GTPase [Methanoculleus sp. 7T]MCK8517989.1 EF-Tu/IF-2/RF-3 family GTPase [Methanoculleus sp. 7T]
MGNLNLAVLGPAGYAKDLGKKGTVSDITFYNLKKGADTVTIIEPTRYPERLAPLFYAASMADAALVVVGEITPTFGEWVLMLNEAGVDRGYIVLQNYLTSGDLAPLLRGTVLEHYEFVDEDPITLRDRLLREAHARQSVEPAAGVVGTIPLDHHFNVRGIGTVILGGVVRGGIRKHDTLKVYPGEKAIMVRSIQKHDDDFDWAAEGDRVGLALKNIESDELDRGFVLSNDPAVQSRTSLEVRAHLVKYWPAPLTAGTVLHIGHWMQFIPARVEAVRDDGDWRQPTLTLALEKDLVYLPGDTAVLHYLEGGKLRIAGRIELP